MSTQPFHKDDERDDLLALASDVTSSTLSTFSLTARDAARALVGVVGWATRSVGIDGMQERMALLVRHKDAWSSGLRDLPTGYDGRVDEHIVMIAVFASGLMPLMGVGNLRAAMAFWATERDAAIWQQVAA